MKRRRRRHYFPDHEKRRAREAAKLLAPPYPPIDMWPAFEALRAYSVLGTRRSEHDAAVAIARAMRRALKQLPGIKVRDRAARQQERERDGHLPARPAGEHDHDLT